MRKKTEPDKLISLTKTQKGRCKINDFSELNISIRETEDSVILSLRKYR